MDSKTETRPPQSVPGCIDAAVGHSRIADTGRLLRASLSDAFPRFCENLSREVIVVDGSCKDYCANHSGVHVDRVSACRSARTPWKARRELLDHAFELLSEGTSHWLFLTHLGRKSCDRASSAAVVPVVLAQI